MKERLDFLLKTIKNAGDIALGYFDKGDALQIQEKATQDFVSEADIAVERYVVREITKHFPNDSIVGEEGIWHKQSSLLKDDIEKGCWLIDPIDGTTNYITGFLYWGISIAFYQHGDVKLGAIHAPALGRLYHSIRGNGFFLNNADASRRSLSKKSLHASKPLIGLGIGYRVDPMETAKLLQFVKDLSYDYRKLSCCSLMLADTALGNFSAYYEPFINSWDCAAGLLMVSESFGKHNNFFEETNAVQKGNALLAAVNADIYNTFSSLLKKPLR